MGFPINIYEYFWVLHALNFGAYKLKNIKILVSAQLTFSFKKKIFQLVHWYKDESDFSISRSSFAEKWYSIFLDTWFFHRDSGF